MPPPENDVSDSSTQSRVFSTKFSTTNPATPPKKKKKVAAKKTPPKVTTSTTGDLAEVFKPISRKDPIPTTSPKQTIPGVLLFLLDSFFLYRMFLNILFYRTT